MTKVRGVSVNKRKIGDGQPCFIIAEAGSNHNGSLERAKQLIQVAASAGADAVKFQVFRAQKLYPRRAGTSDYLKTRRSIYDIIAEMEFPYDWLPILAASCRKQRVQFLASVFDEESADRVDPYVEAFKIASYELTHLPLVRHIARKKKPVIVSTGTATFDEVKQLVTTVRRAGNRDLILMQCTAAYPAPLASLNVRAIVTLKSAFGVPVGLSDHSRDPWVGPLTAVALGANVIEKHVTLSNALPGPDHRFAVEPQELRLMVQKIREAEAALGNGRKHPHAVEAELRAFARRSVFAVRDIGMGEVFSPDNIAVLRRGKLSSGLEPSEYPRVLNRRAARSIPAETALRWDDVR